MYLLSWVVQSRGLRAFMENLANISEFTTSQFMANRSINSICIQFILYKWYKLSVLINEELIKLFF